MKHGTDSSYHQGCRCADCREAHRVATYKYRHGIKEYALYKGDELLGIGTLEQLAQLRGIQKRSIMLYGRSCYKKRKGASMSLVRI